MNYLKFSSKILFSLSFLCTFYFSANVLTDADYIKGQKMKNGEEVSSTKYKNERLIFKGSPKQLDVETKSINIKHKYEKDSNFIIKNGNSKESNKFIKSRNLPNNTYDSDLVDKPAEYSKKPKYDTKYLPYESQGSETRNCADCQYDFTNYGSECCDSAWSDFGIDCATLESNYNWDCSGCACPGDDNGDCSGCLSDCVNANTSEFCQNLENVMLPHGIV